MLRDITIGQYYDIDSPVHRLDPRTKLLGTLLFLAATFVAQNFFSLLACAVFIGIVIGISKVPLSYMMRGMKTIVFFLLFSFVLNVLTAQGEVIVSFWIFHITWEGIQNALMIALRLVLLMFGSSLMTFTTTPLMLSDALENLMKPLSYIKVPVRDIATMINIALRFIPVLLEETDRIMKAQKSRGVDLEKGKLSTRIKGLVPIFVPLLLSLFKRADELALAMEARLYRSDTPKSRLHPLKMRAADFVALGFCLVLLAATIVMTGCPSLTGLIHDWVLVH